MFFFHTHPHLRLFFIESIDSSNSDVFPNPIVSFRVFFFLYIICKSPRKHLSAELLRRSKPSLGGGGGGGESIFTAQKFPSGDSEKRDKYKNVKKK